MTDTGTAAVADLAAKLDSARNWAAQLNEENAELEARIAEARHAIRSGAASLADVGRLLGDNVGEDL